MSDLNLTSNFDIAKAMANYPFSGKPLFVGNSTVVVENGVPGTDNTYAGSSPLQPYATLDYAIGQAVASRTDTIFVLPGHAESLTTAGAIAIDVSGIRIIGLGDGALRPTFTFSSSDNSATMTMSGSNSALKNVILVCNDDGLTNALVVTGDNCEVDIEFRDTSSAIETATAVRLDTANNCKLKLVYKGFTGGNALVSAVRLDDCDNVEIYIDGYGICSTAWVEMVDVASTNVFVTGRLYTQGITNFSRDVVDTITGSTWTADIFDASAGCKASGGSAAALAGDDVSSVATALAVVDAFHDVPTADVTTNAQMRDVIGNKTDAVLADTVEGTAATTKTIVAMAKSIMQRIGADSANNSAATTLVVANADGSVLEREEYIQTDMLALPRCVEKSDGAVLSGADDIFTIAGGPIKILEITGIVTTAIGAGTTNAKLQITTTEPAATVDMNAAAVDIDADAAGTSYQTINTTGIFTPVTAGYVKEANSFATTPTTFLAPIGTIKFTSDAARTGNIKWYLRYVPLSPSSRVTAAA
jgi:hypothetical protein